MVYPRKSTKRNRNESSIADAMIELSFCPCNHPVEQEKQAMNKQQRNDEYLPHAISAGTAATSTSSDSIGLNTSMAEEEYDSSCPVTGAYSRIHDDYDVSPKILGKGHYGVVRQCTHLGSNRTLAVKSIEKSKIGRIDHLQREIYLLANINHQSIMKMVDCYEDDEYLHIVTEKYTGGELFDKIIEKTSIRGCMSERQTASIIKSLLEAVAYLHDNEIVHRDIKPENILFESELEDADIKLIDFGLSRRHEDGEKPMSNQVGTSYYMPPELLKGSYNKSCDIWSVGIVAYLLLCGYPPFNGHSDEDIQDSIRRGKFQFAGSQWITKSDDSVDFIRCLLRRDSRKRYTAKEALMHPWIRNMMAL